MRRTQIPLFAPETEWVAPHELKDLSGAKEIAIDLETKDPNIKTKGAGWATFDGHIVGFAVAALGRQWYFPIHHDAGGNMDEGITCAWMQDVLNLPATKIFHNASYDVGWLLVNGFDIKGKIVDTMIAAAIINENGNEDIYLHFPTKRAINSFENLYLCKVYNRRHEIPWKMYSSGKHDF